MVKNELKQRELDERKWNVSKEFECDMSGRMPYCDYCPKRATNMTCLSEQKERESLFLCAKAYNKLRRERKTLWE